MKRIYAALLAVVCALALFTPVQARADSPLDGVMSGLGSFWNSVTDAASEFGVQVGAALGELKDQAGSTIDSYISMAESAIRANLPELDNEELSEALNTLLDGVREGKEVASQEVRDAYAKLDAWLDEQSGVVADGTRSVLDTLASAAGVAEAKLSMLWRTVDAYVTSKADTIDQDVKDAWEVVKQFAQDGTLQSQEALENALATLNAWLESNHADSAINQALRQAIDLIMQQLYG